MMLNIAKICLAIAIVATLNSLWATWAHVSDAQYDIHAQLHFSREVFVSMAILIIATYVMYGSVSGRSRAAWMVMAIGIVFVTSGFWVSIMITGAEVPSLSAALNHLFNTVFGLAALGMSWPSFNQPAVQ